MLLGAQTTEFHILVGGLDHCGRIGSWSVQLLISAAITRKLWSLYISKTVTPGRGRQGQDGVSRRGRRFNESVLAC